MVILHIANINNIMFSGVCIAVPQHVIAQQKIEKVALLNIAGVEIEGIKEQFIYKKPFRLNQLSEPYNKPDIVVFHEVYYPAYLSICSELIKQKIPYVIVPHGCLTTGAQHIKYLKKKIGNFLLFNRYIKNAAAIQCLSEGELLKTKFRGRKFIGTNGVGIPKKRKEKFREDRMELLYIGRLDMYHKGLDILIEAIRMKVDFLRRNHCVIKIYGPNCNGGYDRIQWLLKENNVTEFVELNHEIFGRDKEDALLFTDLFIQTSRFEGMPMGILEALSYGIPCIVTKGTTVGEIIGKYNAGWMAETDADSVAETLERAVLDRERWREMSVNAVELIKNKFGWEEIVRETVGTYREVMEVYTTQYVRGENV